MNLIKVTKLTGAKRLHRKYKIENKGHFSFNLGVLDDLDVIEFESKYEEEFLEEVKKEREKQKVELSKKLRTINVIDVEDVTDEQGTKEWLQARLGKITASDTPYNSKGLKIPSYDDYVDKKVAEKILLELGVEKEENFSSSVTDLGHALEPKAISDYEELTGNKVVLKGFVSGKTNQIGASTDGITTDEDFNKINIEIKSVFMKAYISELTRGALVKKYYAQMQTQMYVLNIDVTHFLVQCQQTDKVKLIVRDVKRDEGYICNLIETLKCFEEDFRERYEIVKNNIKRVEYAK